MTAGARVDATDGWRVGEDKQLVFTITDQNGAPLDPTGWQCRYELHRRRAAHGATPLLSLAVTGALGVVPVPVPAALTAALTPGTYEHVLWRTDPGSRAVLAQDSVALGGTP